MPLPVHEISPPPRSTAGASALLSLRAATSAEHAAIERQLSLERICDARQYAGIVAVFEWFIRHWQRRVAAALPPERHDWLEARSRLPMARADLHALGQARCKAPDPTTTIPLGGEAAALGSMYVIEGSALGGQVIASALAERLGIGRDSGAAYFHGHGEHTGRHWREFRTLAESRLSHSAQDGAAAVAAARETFRALSAAFARQLPDCHGASA
jgi:heme oxygenase (biliverdin-IX-beta and delta-forming)